jgi:hypothetical protein
MQTENTTPSGDEPDRTPADTNLAPERPSAPEDLKAPLDELGQSDEERLDTVAERNQSLEDRLPGDQRERD